MLKINNRAPDFSVATNTGADFRLSEAMANVILYFYPKDDTPGCTMESTAFSERAQLFEELGTKIIGISLDTVESHCKFAAKHNLGVILGADVDQTVSKLYGVLKEKSFFGKKYLGIERSTFLIDSKGVIRYIWQPVKIIGHADDVLKELKQIMG